MLTKLFDVKDEIDQLILSEICNPAIFQLQVGEVVFLGDKKRKDIFSTSIMGITGALLKAKEHRRKYHIFEKQKIEDIQKEVEKFKITSDLGYDPVELNSEVDAFLVQIKSALDQLAVSLNPLHGFNLNGWHKKKNRSGEHVLASFNNLSKDKKEKFKGVIDLLEKNISWLSYLVFLRDNPVHKGGAKNITPMIFEKANGKIIPQRILHNNDTVEDMSVFIDRTMNEIIWFVSNFILGSIQSSIGGLLLVKTSNGYGWGIPSNLAHKDKNS